LEFNAVIYLTTIVALYEAHLDYRVVKYVRNMDLAGLAVDEKILHVKRELLVVCFVSNILLDNMPLSKDTKS
jgi:hypothetical protein